jgi:hypothetical protein
VVPEMRQPQSNAESAEAEAYDGRNESW